MMYRFLDKITKLLQNYDKNLARRLFRMPKPVWFLPVPSRRHIFEILPRKFHTGLRTRLKWFYEIKIYNPTIFAAWSVRCMYGRRNIENADEVHVLELHTSAPIYLRSINQQGYL